MTNIKKYPITLVIDGDPNGVHRFFFEVEEISYHSPQTALDAILKRKPDYNQQTIEFSE